MGLSKNREILCGGHYEYILNIAAWVFLIRAAFFGNTVYRKQAIALFFGVGLIIVPNILYILGISPVKRFDITPLFFGPAGLIIALGIFRFKLLDLVPLARTTVIETMDAGVMVLDLQDRILDTNPAFEKIVGLAASQISTRRVEEVCGKIPELATACMDRSIAHTEFSINTKEFITALKKDILSFEDQTGLSIKLDIPGEFTGEELKPNIRINMLNIVKEA